jgi:hypothetical protein
MRGRLLIDRRQRAGVHRDIGLCRPAAVAHELANVEEARELTDSDKIKPLIADLDRVWGNRVSRRREILEIVQEIVS